jgi:hypothetical protein
MPAVAGTGAIVESNLKQPIPVQVANHPRPVCSPFFRLFQIKIDIEMVSIQAAVQATPRVLRTQVSSIYGLI